MLAAGSTRPRRRRRCRGPGHRGDLRAHAAVRRSAPDLSAVRGAAEMTGAAAAARHARGAGVHHLPRHHRRGRAAAAGEGLRADRRGPTSLSPSRRSGSTRATGLRHPQHAEGRRRAHPGLHRRRGAASTAALRPGGPGQVRARGGDGQAAGEHLPAREHRAGQRDGDVLPRAGHRPLGRDRCAATKPFGFRPFHPGPGVGGHCIPIDPNYLSYKVRDAGSRSGSSSWRRRSTAACPATWSTGRRAAEHAAKPLNGAECCCSASPTSRTRRPAGIAGRGHRPEAVLARRRTWPTTTRTWTPGLRPPGSPLRRVTDLDAESQRRTW